MDESVDIPGIDREIKSSCTACAFCCICCDFEILDIVPDVEKTFHYLGEPCSSLFWRTGYCDLGSFHVFSQSKACPRLGQIDLALHQLHKLKRKSPF